jgi:septum formation protein
MKSRTLILASSSPRRQELIRSLGLPFVIRISDADETMREGATPVETVETLSLRKARIVYESMKPFNEEGGIVIGSDTIVVYGGNILGKPTDKQNAFQMLRKLQGNIHHVYSGVACVDADTGQFTVAHRVTKVKMKRLSDEQINAYIATGEPMDKAGSYAIQGIGATIVEEIEGDYFNVVGLPVSLLSDMLLEYGVRVL